jgi:uncharacterized protein (TIGR02099 family)
MRDDPRERWNESDKVELGLSLLRFWLLPHIEGFREPLAAQLGARIGERLRIEGLASRLRGFRPELVLRGLHILDPQGQSAIRFAQVRLNLAPWRSLRAGEPRFDRARIEGSRLSLRRRADGALTILGLTTGGEPPGWLLADGQVELRDAALDYQDAAIPGAPLDLGRVDLKLDNRLGRHRLSADFKLPQALGQKLRLVLDAEGDLFGSAWRGSAYLEALGVDVGALSSRLPQRAFGLSAGHADLKAWLRWQDGVTLLAGDFSLNGPVLRHRTGAEAGQGLALRGLSGQFAWRPSARGWRLDFPRLQPHFRAPWPETHVALAVENQPDGSLASLSAAASRLDVADVSAALGALGLLGEQGTAALAGLSPHGALEDAVLFYAPGRIMAERLGVRGRFRGLGIKAWQAVPGVEGLDGSFEGTGQSGHVEVSSRAASLDLGRLKLKRPVRFSRLNARLLWEQGAEDYALSFPTLSARTTDFDLDAQGRAVLSQRPYLAFTVRLGTLGVMELRDYLPCAVVADTCRWAEKGVQGGRVARSDILFDGFPADFPFYHDEGVFEAELETENLKLQFSPDWLPLTQTYGHISFKGPGAVADIGQGRIGPGRIVQAHAVIPDMLMPKMSVTGKVQASVPESLDFLAHSPLRQIPERLLKVAEVSGEADIAMDMTVPLDNRLSGGPVAQGVAELHQASLNLKSADFGLTAMEGPLHFNGDGIRAEGVRARFLDQPARVAATQQGDDIALELRSHIDQETLARRFPSEVWRHAQGASDYRLNLTFPASLDARSVPLRLELESDLKGLALDLPAPLGKPETSPAALALEASIPADAPVLARLSYGPDVKARARLVEEGGGYRVDSADLAIGQALPANIAPGLGLYARLDVLDGGDWQRWWARQDSGAGPGGLALMRELQFQCDQLAWDGARLGPFSLSLEREGQRWTGQVRGAWVKGGMVLTPELLSFDLASLRWPKRDPGPPRGGTAPQPAVTGPSAEVHDIDPADIPSLKLRVQHLQWQNADLGALEIDTERRAHGMLVKHFTVKAGNHALDLHGQWTRTPARKPSTQLEGKLHIERLGELLALLGHAGKVRDTASDLHFALNWPGAPWRFAAADVAGEATLSLGKGGLLKVEPGLGRMIGMLNLDSLWRRLSLDFSDLFGQGLAYDSIAGSVRLGGGQAVTEGFLVDAVSARILVSGKANLVSRDLDQTVTVVPHASVALPIAGVLAGGPAVGAAAYVAQRLIGEHVDNLAATQYAVTGSWNDPAISRVNRYMPLDMLDRAWTGVKDISGLGSAGPAQSAPEPPPGARSGQQGTTQ